MPMPWPTFPTKARQAARLLPAMALLLPGVADAETRVALVVGNTDYQALPPLRTAAVDARQFGAALERLGFETVLGVDLDSEEFPLAVQELAREAAGAEAAVVAYFGHGQQVDALNYLLPTDFGTETTPDVQLDAVALRTLMQGVAQAEVGVVLVDAGRPTGLDIPGAEAGLARPQSVPPGVVVNYSSEPGVPVMDDVLFQSAYGAALAEAVAVEDLPLRDLLLRVRQSVVNETGGDQRPVSFGPVETISFTFHPAAVAPVPDAEPEVVAELPEGRPPAGLPAPPEADDRAMPDAAADASDRPPRVEPSPAGEEPLIERASDAAPDAREAEIGGEEAAPGGPDPGIDVEVDLEPPDRADTALEEPLAEPPNPDELPAPPLPIPTEPGGAASDVDVGELDPETPRAVTATPDADGVAPSPAEARQEVATPADDEPQAAARPDETTAAVPASAERDPPLTEEERRAVQRALRTLGYYEYFIDAIFGPVTRAGMRAFQESLGAEPTGHLSRAQIDRLYELAEQAE